MIYEYVSGFIITFVILSIIGFVLHKLIVLDKFNIKKFFIITVAQSIVIIAIFVWVV